MADILIVGGGIAGLSAGARLSPHAKVLLLEAEDALGYHASGRSAALIEQNYGAPSVQALNRASFGYLADGGYLTQRGLLIVAESHEKQAFDVDVVEMGVTPIGPSEAQDLVPILDPSKVALAAYHADAHDIDTDRLMQDFRREILAHGGELLTRTRVTAISKTETGWRVTAGEKVFEVRTLVNAAGAWADRIGQMAGIAPMGIVPHRRSMARIPAPGGHDVSRWPMFFGTGEAWYAKPDAGALIVSPADADPCDAHDAFANDMTLAEGLDRYGRMVTEPVTRLLSSWAGLRSFAPDKSLVLGRDPDCPEFIWCAGQGGYGFQTAPAASQLLADLVLARQPALDPATVKHLTPERLRT